MPQASPQTLVITLWIAMITIIALFMGMESAIGWTVIAGASVLPPLAMLWIWKAPRVSVAESIRQTIQ